MPNSIGAVPIFDVDGQLLGYRGVDRDITDRKRSEEQLRESEERYRLLADYSADFVSLHDADGRALYVSPSFFRATGWTPEDLDTTDWRMRFHPDDLVMTERAIEANRRGETTRQEHRILCKDATSMWLERRAQPVFGVDGQVEKVVGWARDITDRKRLERDVLCIAEEEQQRIAQDLHDGTQQELAGLGLLTQTLALKLSQGNGDGNDAKATELCELATKVVDGIARTHQEVRAVSRGLAAVKLSPQGLMDALHELASRTDDLEGITCSFKCEQPVEVADSLTATHLYRIAQEAIANALKHGQPEHILIALESNNGQLILQVADDGVGFDTAQKNEGMGLKTMRYRASLIGGSATVSPVDSGGTLVTCRISEGEIR